MMTLPAPFPLAPEHKAHILIEALPYIQQFQGTLTVIKLGGSALEDPQAQWALLQDVALLHMVGLRPLLVHGGGPAINQQLQALGKTPQFANGLRVTDADTLAVAEQVLSGQVGKALASSLGQLGVNALSLSGKDAQLLHCRKAPLTPEGDDLGWVGDVEHINTKVLLTLMEQGFLPILSSLGVDAQGHTYNLNADHVAVAVATALKAPKLVFMTNTLGVLRDVAEPSSLISQLPASQVPQLIAQGVISGGMIPKVACCLQAIEAGVQRVHILNGCQPHSLLLEIFTDAGVGTVITP